jgi:hypothetical protein
MNKTLAQIAIGALLVVFSSFVPVSNTDQLVMAAAESQLPVFLSKIPAGHIRWYGFKAEDDLDLLEIGKPFRVLMLTNDFYSGPLEDDKNYFIIKNEWFVPVSINGVNRTLLTMDGNPGNYLISAMGDTLLTKELQEQSAGANKDDDFYILRIPRLRADFFVDETNNSYSEAHFTPLLNAVLAMPSLSNTSRTSFTLNEMEKAVKEALSRKSK